MPGSQSPSRGDDLPETKWCLVIPFNSKAKAIYAGKCLKDYVAMDKVVMEIELRGNEQPAEYQYIERVI